MSASRTKYRFLFAGGGTGGHLFPAVAVADKIKELIPEAEIMFVGTKSKIEGRVVPQLGYKFSPIWIKGFSRKLTAENLLFPIKLSVSVLQSILISIKFKPVVAIGSGGYVSGPAVYGARMMGAKVILLEQNSLPGVTTKILSRYAEEIHISFKDSLKYFTGKKKVFVTGNPVRENLSCVNKPEALKKFSLSADKKTLLILGGSLGAGTLNEAAAGSVKALEDAGIQVIWQTGKLYYEKYKHLTSANTKVIDFIDDMNSAYSAADLIVSRAGATTIAEITVLGLPSVLIPSPNVAENHQYYNAKSLADEGAAVLIKDKEIKENFFSSVKDLMHNNSELLKLSENAKKLGKPYAAAVIARQAIKYAEGL